MAISPLKAEEIAFEHPCFLVLRPMLRRTITRKCNDRSDGCKTRNRLSRILAIVLPAALAACAPKGVVPAAMPPVAGGWQAAFVKDDEVMAAAAYAAARLPQGHGGVAAVISAERQIVAGTNLRLRLRMADGTGWRVTVWRRLDGSHELVQAIQMP